MAANYQKARSLRDKAQRRVDDLKKSMQDAPTPAVRERIKKDIKRIQRAMSDTRTYSKRTGKRMHTSKQVESGLNRLSRLVEQFPLTTPHERNKSFETRMHLATNQKFQGPTLNPRRTVGEEMAGMTRAEVQVFYRATQAAWQDKPVEERDRAIMDYYKERDLQKLFEQVMANERNKQVALAHDILANPEDYTNGEKKWAFEVLDDNDTDVRYMQSVVGMVVTELSPVAPM